MKNKIITFSVIMIFLGMILSRVLVKKFGENIRAIIMIIMLAFLLFILVIIILQKKYFVALKYCSIIIPLTLMTIGVCVNNEYVGIIGFMLLFILIPIMIKISSRYNSKY